MTERASVVVFVVICVTSLVGLLGVSNLVIDRRIKELESLMEQKFAHRWGYDQDTKVFTVLLHESAPEGIYQLRPKLTRSQGRHVWVGKAKGGQRLGLKIELNEDGGAAAELVYGTKVVNTMWCKPSVSKCPSCGHEL